MSIVDVCRLIMDVVIFALGCSLAYLEAEGNQAMLIIIWVMIIFGFAGSVGEGKVLWDKWAKQNKAASVVPSH